MATNKRIDWVVNGKRYDRVSSTHILNREHQSFLRGRKQLTMYLSPNGQFFIVNEDDGTIKLIGRSQAISWLEKFNAPSAAYRSAGIDIKDG